jgi:hypothetical protein
MYPNPNNPVRKNIGNLMRAIPAHKQTDPAKAPGQIVNPIPPSKLYKPAHGGYPG